ncbi:hypothetical protein [Streptacidiphilus neutrinimicus]|uniref:hypothetical protein n=1 Tax=Streptacidiphilus neutrinimicus TaxID=105420 RepID=UPI0005A8C109|nr:hypothetical protein [Streptacidiphilus neutrinimicus]
MLTLTHSDDGGTVLHCPHPPDMVAAALRQIGWVVRSDGQWRLRGSAGHPADERRIRLTQKALRRRGFTLTVTRTHARTQRH